MTSYSDVQFTVKATTDNFEIVGPRFQVFLYIAILRLICINGYKLNVYTYLYKV